MSTRVKRTVTGEPKKSVSTASRTMYKPKTTYKTKKEIKQAVYEELSKQLELKNSIVGYSNVAIQRSIPSGVVFNGAGNFFRLMPQIQQSTTGAAGNAYNERIGNSISLKELDIHGYLSYISPAVQSTSTNDQKLAVRVMILRAKDINDAGVLFDNMPTGALLRFDGGTTTYNGNALDSFRDINRDLFTVRYDQVHYLNAPVLLPGTGGGEDLVSVPSGLKIFRTKMRFGRGLKLNFTNSGDTLANNFPYFMVIGYSSMSGTGQPTNSLVRCTVDISGKYTDA